MRLQAASLHSSLVRSRRQVYRRLLSTEGDTISFDFRTSRLGLIPTFIRPALSTLTQLPEVKSAVEVLQGLSKPTPSLDGDLERASQVLQHVGKTEYHASLALRAEVHQHTGNHGKANETVSALLNDNHNTTNVLDLQLAHAKTSWYCGDFDVTQQICHDLLEADDIHAMPLYYASALSGLGLGKLMACQSLEEAYTCRDPTRMALKFLQTYNHPLPLLAAHLNMGAAEVLYGQVVGGARQVKVPMDAALRMWAEGLQLLERQHYSDSQKQMAAALAQRLHVNMSMGILKVDDGMDDIVEDASEQAGDALKLADDDASKSNDDKEFLKRILTVLAACYHKAGKAVTSEGLLQSAISLPLRGDVLSKIDQKSAYETYSRLCHDWEKRQGDADKMKQKAAEAEQRLPEAWRGKSEVVSSLWFWTPGDFQS